MNIKARATCLVFSKILIVINKYEKIYFTTYISDKRLSSFFFFFSFIPFHILFSSFFPFFFRFKFVLSEQNVHSLLPTYLGGTSFPLLDVYERSIFSGGEGVRVHSVHSPPPPLRTRLVVLIVIS